MLELSPMKTPLRDRIPRIQFQPQGIDNHKFAVEVVSSLCDVPIADIKPIEESSE